jgi:uncharacterized protein (DUF885 family)
MSEHDAALCRAQNVIDAAWARTSDGFFGRVVQGRAVDGFPDLSEQEAHRTAGRARAVLAEVDAIDVTLLPHELALTLKVATFQLAVEAQADERYWLAHLYGGFPSLFPVAPYGGGGLLRYVWQAFSRFTFNRPGDADRYLALIEDCAYLLDQMRQKLEEQASRGIRIPRPALPGVRAFLAGQTETARKVLMAERAARRAEELVMPAFARLLEVISADYERLAPEGVGMAQYPDGIPLYESLVAEHLSMPMSIETVHRLGMERIAELEAEMAQIRSRLGYPDREAFHRHLLVDRSWAARTDADVQARYDNAIRRIEPHLDSLFHTKPSARWRAARLDPQLEGGMTYGYYHRPMAGHPDGVYYFNGGNISERTLTTAASLIFHELIPGHHLHLASQQENELLHPIRRHALFNAFNEGWAEYAATLAGEIGMYADPYERYGRLLMDAFLTCRLVVDTGMNALGWPLERARQYMRDHTAMSEAEIRSETLRYSTDIPAQSLAYKVGEIKLHELRNRARAALGERFDLRDFHDAVVGGGGMPLDVLEWHVEHWLRTKTGGRAA